MTQILYIVGDGSKNSDWELRWSLRSLDKFALDEVEPVIVGKAPDWYSGKKLACSDKFQHKEMNLNRKIMKAIEAGVVKGKFQISCDDNFWLKPTEFARLPVYAKNMRIMERDMTGLNSYGRAMQATDIRLEAYGYTRYDTACHINTWVDELDMGNVRGLIEGGNTWETLGWAYGVVAFLVWPNARLTRLHEAEKVVLRRDLKYRGEPEFEKFIEGADEFSINDDAFKSEKFINFMMKTFDKASRWES